MEDPEVTPKIWATVVLSHNHNTVSMETRCGPSLAPKSGRRRREASTGKVLGFIYTVQYQKQFVMTTRKKGVKMCFKSEEIPKNCNPRWKLREGKKNRSLRGKSGGYSQG